jgi:hypothetical protein
MTDTKHTTGRAAFRGRIGHRLLVASCAFACFAMIAAAGHAEEAGSPPAGAKVMTGVELYMLYHDKTWLWPEGAGRMQDAGRRFAAWSGSGSNATWAEGKWVVTNAGLLCLEAKWHSHDGTYPNRTCFSHRKLGQTIYQKKEPDGAWYVFKSAVPTDGDEFDKLVREDRVTSKLKAMQPSPEAGAG